MIEAFLQNEAHPIVHVMFFLIIIGGIIHLHIKLNTMIEQLTSERVDAILKVSDVAEQLASRVTTIAEKLRVDVGQQQQVVQQSIDNASAAIHHELIGKSEDPATARDQIDAIKHATDALVDKINGTKGGEHR